AGDVVGELGAAAITFVVDEREVVFEVDTRADGADRREHRLEEAALLVVDEWIVGDEEGAPVEEEAPGRASAAHDAHRVRAMAILRSGLAEVLGAALHVAQRGRRAPAPWGRLEPPAALVGAPPPRLLDAAPELADQLAVARGHRVEVEEDDRVGAGVVIAPQ